MLNMGVIRFSPLYLLGASLLFPFLGFKFLSLSDDQIRGFQAYLSRWAGNEIGEFLPSNDNDWFNSMKTEYNIGCPEQYFHPYILTFDPLIIYLEKYLSYKETRYLVQLAEENYEVSGLAEGEFSKKVVDKAVRSSFSAVLPEDPVVACVERRSLDFQGFLPTSQIENLQTVRYKKGDVFHSHFDWLSGVGESGKTNPRLSTIFAYLQANDCIGGSTQFPRILGNFPEKWCKFIDCESDDAIEADGIGFMPLVGNAVLFMQYYPNGTEGHPDVLHQGMPVREGTKVGLNIMTRQFPGYSSDF